MLNAADRGQPDAPVWVAGEADAVVLCRPGKPVNTGGEATQFSSVHFFEYTPASMRVVDATDCYDCKLVSPETTFRLTGVLSGGPGRCWPTPPAPSSRPTRSPGWAGRGCRSRT